MSERSYGLHAPRPRSPYVLDGLVAPALSVLCLAAFFTAERTPEQPRDADALGVALTVVAAASLAFRRRWLVAVFLSTAGATVAVYLLDYPDSGLPFIVLIALYAVTAPCDRRITIAATVALLLTIAFVIADASEMDPGHPRWHPGNLHPGGRLGRQEKGAGRV